jgi:hypothetical protein
LAHKPDVDWCRYLKIEALASNLCAHTHLCVFGARIFLLSEKKSGTK